MNKDLPVGHNDPRTQMVPFKYLQLTASLIIAGQNWDYWKAVPIVEGPNDRIAFEELRQVGVFFPLVLVAAAFYFFGLIGAGVGLLAALPLMKMLNNALREAIARQGAAWFARDAGRYAYTQFMCKEFDLRPHEVTKQLVDKMFVDFQTWGDIAKRVSREDAGLAEQAHKHSAKFQKTVSSPVAASAIRASVKSVAAAFATGAAIVTDNDVVADAIGLRMAELQINPATGLPLMDGGMLDIHGNVSGTSNADDFWHDSSSFSGNTGSDFSSFDDCNWHTDT